ncbi:DUF222 domain-containing protein [Pseudarthrobacter sp. HLT3-5]|uniref:DUF222 domain-containing protein n=1 Tax=Pseudarthrobacter cellobiosi TaxID=2953654 RepID=UPI00208E8683|nr:DUF222 domain-containing protein [Pseudarthrobacter sp. HLT3-5]MCO4275883.1 DUF222 domain-containing protein [Pseudarthrobacter sp. HLT3-5]
MDRTRTAAINAAGPASKAADWTGLGHRSHSPARRQCLGNRDRLRGGFRSGGTTCGFSSPGCRQHHGAGDDSGGGAGSGPVEDGCRNIAEFLRVRLWISAGEARSRLALAAAVLLGTDITGQPTPPAWEHTATDLAAGTIASRAGTIITTALEKARPIAEPAILHKMEAKLIRTAIENDHDHDHDHDILALPGPAWINQPKENTEQSAA